MEPSTRLSATTSELMNAFSSGGLLIEVVGEERAFNRIASIEDGGTGDLVFVDKEEYIPLVRERRPSVAVISSPSKGLLSGLSETTLVIAANVNLAQAMIKQKYGARQFERADWPRIHPSAVIPPTAMIASTATVEPKAVIGNWVRIGDRVRVMSGVVIEHDATVGDDTVIHPNAVIGYGCTIGSQVVVGACSVIGSEGYGFAQDVHGKSHPIPQTGVVVIEDRVRVGANCCIDRAAYCTTRIGAGTKLDNLCHIAHNVDVGEDCLLTSMLCVAGSTRIGNRVMTSGQTGILDHVTICDDVVLVHRAGVTKDISKPGVYAGGPVQPLHDYMRNTATVHRLAELRKRVAHLEKS
ncbi:MAG TPA: UDP-3-O-(3-hydroxymyristoyl)glucosamine N-acyltransferase [Syntrophobacteraceae bacterium]|nr:UDP-3-O-(3-hydroxymyristoyl)glucosamine N-acyltransferase [Syntrophobacteraceae bacterium]